MATTTKNKTEETAASPDPNEPEKVKRPDDTEKELEAARAEREERLKGTKLGKREDPVPTPPPTLAEEDSKVILTLNTSGNVKSVEFAGNSYMIAQGQRAKLWAMQIQRQAREKAAIVRYEKAVEKAKKDASAAKKK